MGRNEAIALARELLNRVAALDFAKVGEMLADDVKAMMPFSPSPISLSGRENFVRFMEDSVPQFLKWISFEIQTELFDPERQVVVLEYRSEGQLTDGRPYGNQYVGLIGVRDGRVTLWKEYYNPAKLGGGGAFSQSAGQA